MTGDYAVEVTKEGIALDRNNSEGLKIVPVTGMCAANSEGETVSRGREWYIENVLNLMVERGEIGNGIKTKFDDRKLRLDFTSITRQNIFLGFGATHYLAYKRDLSRDPSQNDALQQRGLEEFDDRYAFFSRAPGIAGLVISSEGSVFIGERESGTDDPGVLNAVAGHLTYKDTVEQVNLEEELRKEAKEEMGIMSEEIDRTVFVGGYLHPNRGDMDFAYLIFTKLPDNYFASGEWIDRVAEREHKHLVRLAGYSEVQRLLNDGIAGDKKARIMYSTRGALNSVRPEEIAA
jgi:hypothetical protein